MSSTGFSKSHSGLKDALSALRATAKSISRQLLSIQKLQANLENVNEETAALTGNINREDALARWSRYVSGELEPKLTDVLTWLEFENVVDDQKFIDFFSEYLRSASSGRLIRIFRRYLDLFTRLSKKDKLRDLLAESLLSRFSDARGRLRVFFYTDSPARLAKLQKERKGLALPKPEDLKLTLANWEVHLRREGEFFIEFVNHYMSLCCKDLEKLDLDETDFLIRLFSELIDEFDRDRLQLALSDLFTVCSSINNTAQLTMIAEFILKHKKLGDPSLNKSNWRCFREEIIDQVRSLLQRFDLNYFFHALFSKREDPHGRRKFWDQYVGKAKRVKVFVSQRDLRSFPDLRKIVEERGYNVISANDSCFAMYFNGYVVVEFAETGNAVYIYHEPEFETVLKRQSKGDKEYGDIKSRELVKGKISHIEGWEEYAKSILRRLRII